MIGWKKLKTILMGFLCLILLTVSGCKTTQIFDISGTWQFENRTDTPWIYDPLELSLIGDSHGGKIKYTGWTYIIDGDEAAITIRWKILPGTNS